MNDSIPDIFISYSSKDVEWVAVLAQALTDCGYSVWWDQELRVGENYHKAIEKALKSARCVITVWSPTAVESEWVVAESNHAKDRRVLVPLVYRTAEIPLAFQARQNADLQGWWGDANEAGFQELLRGIEGVLHQPTKTNRPSLKHSMLVKNTPWLRIGRKPIYLITVGVLLCLVLAIVFLSQDKTSGGMQAGGDISIGSGNIINMGDGDVNQSE